MLIHRIFKMLKLLFVFKINKIDYFTLHYICLTHTYIYVLCSIPLSIPLSSSAVVVLFNGRRRLGLLWTWKYCGEWQYYVVLVHQWSAELGRVSHTKAWLKIYVLSHLKFFWCIFPYAHTKHSYLHVLAIMNLRV